MKKIMIGVAAMLVAGCGSVSIPDRVADFGASKTGVQVSEAQMSTLVDRVSKQADVVKGVGQPSRKAPLASGEAWYYDFTQIGLIGRNISESTVFEFNGRGLLVAHYKTAGSGGSGSNALLKAAGK